MQHLEVDPPPALRDLIKCVWYTRWDVAELETSLEVMPDGYAEVIFYFGSVCRLATPQGEQQLPSPFVVGLLQQPVVFRAQHQLEVIGIRCFPWTIFDLLGLPPGQDGVRRVEHPIAQLQASLAEQVAAGRVAEAITQVQQHLLDAYALRGGDKLLAKAGEAMRATGGTLPVSQVAAAAHATVRTLERKFKQAAGYTVKDVSGLMRFEQVRNHLWQHPTANLAGLAQELGYTDQAHLSREFKRYSGATPAAFARKARGEKGRP